MRRILLRRVLLGPLYPRVGVPCRALPPRRRPPPAARRLPSPLETLGSVEPPTPREDAGPAPRDAGLRAVVSPTFTWHRSSWLSSRRAVHHLARRSSPGERPAHRPRPR